MIIAVHIDFDMLSVCAAGEVEPEENERGCGFVVTSDMTLRDEWGRTPELQPWQLLVCEHALCDEAERRMCR